MECKGRPGKSWLARVDFLRKELDLQDKVFDLKLIQTKSLTIECEEVEVALEHESKLQVRRESKREVEFEEPLLDCCFFFFSFVLVPVGSCFRS